MSEETSEEHFSHDTRSRVPARVGTRPYKRFIDELRRGFSSSRSTQIEQLLDGRAGARCLALVSEPSVRRLGAFFTPSEVASRIVNQFSEGDWSQRVVFDPACGAADLLLPIARTLQVESTVSTTLRAWNERLRGCDISPEFVEAARLRLALLASMRGAIVDADPEQLAGLLTNIRVADGLTASTEYALSSHIVMNPPFGRVHVDGIPWREGLVTAAALFVERAVRLCAPGTEIVALLPEVLRTGSSYAHWRRHVAQFVTNQRSRSIGLFSDQADVDVFIQRLTARPERRSRKSNPKREGRTVGDKFTVGVGLVVPHRHPKKGPEVAFLHAGNATAWSEVRRIIERRKFKGRVFQPPFVVVRRTSRPGDSHRAVATLVLGNRSVAVENHLLVLLPKRGGVSICRKLIRLLAADGTSAVLDRTMRCRHLTTASVSLLPWS